MRHLELGGLTYFGWCALPASRHSSRVVGWLASQRPKSHETHDRRGFSHMSHVGNFTLAASVLYTGRRLHGCTAVIYPTAPRRAARKSRSGK